MNKQMKGFSLIEMMIVLIIIGILAAFAIPSYTKYKVRVNRVEVQTEMMKLAQDLQSYKVANKTYKNAELGSNGLSAKQFPASGSPLYNLALTDINGASLKDESSQINTWLLVAAPVASSTQKDNGVVCLNSRGEKFWEKGASACKLTKTSKWDGD